MEPLNEKVSFDSRTTRVDRTPEAAIHQSRGRNRLHALNWSPSPQYTLPSVDAYTARGKLHRLKGSWKKNWCLEHFLIQSNIFFTCTKEEPYLVKISIPLRNIQSVQIVRDALQVKYIRPKRREKFYLASILVKPYNQKLEEFQSLFRDFWRVAQRSHCVLGDFVEREKAETAITSLYSSVKTTSLVHFFSCLTTAIDAQRHAVLAQTLSTFQMSTKKALANSLRFSRLQRLVYFLNRVVTNYQYTIFIRLKGQLELQYVKQVRDATKDTLASIYVENITRLTEKEGLLYETRLKDVFTMLQRRIIVKSFHTLKMHSFIAGTYKTLGNTALRTIVACRGTYECQHIKRLLLLWKHHTHLQHLRQQALEKSIASRSAWKRSMIVCKWKALSKLVREQQYCGIQRLCSAISSFTRASLHMTLFLWTKHALHQQQLETLQLTANMSQVNANLLRRCCWMSKENACRALVFIVSHLFLSRQKVFFRYFYSRNIYQRRRCVTNGVELIEHIYTKEQRAAFNKWRKGSTQWDYRREQVNLFLNQLSSLLSTHMKQQVLNSFYQWRRILFLSPLYHLLKNITFVVKKQYLQQLTASLRVLQEHTYKTTIVRGLLRLRHLQKLVELSGRRRIIVLAKAFIKWHNVKIPTVNRLPPGFPCWVQPYQTPLPPMQSPSDLHTIFPQRTVPLLANFQTLPECKPSDMITEPSITVKQKQLSSLPIEHLFVPPHRSKQDNAASIEAVIQHTPYRPKYSELVLIQSKKVPSYNYTSHVVAPSRDRDNTTLRYTNPTAYFPASSLSSKITKLKSLSTNNPSTNILKTSFIKQKSSQLESIPVITYFPNDYGHPVTIGKESSGMAVTKRVA